MAQEHADIIYSGGTILPLTGCDATLEAVAVKDGVILACGSRADVEKLAGPDTERVDLAGSTMLPGFYDAHSHFVEVGTGRLIYSNVNCPPYGADSGCSGYPAGKGGKNSEGEVRNRRGV